MKKTYIKPGIIVEDFVLCQNVSVGGCGAAHKSNLGSPTQASRDHCGWDLGGAVLWVSLENKCDVPTGEKADGYLLCYNAPEGGYSIFSS